MVQLILYPNDNYFIISKSMSIHTESIRQFQFKTNLYLTNLSNNNISMNIQITSIICLCGNDGTGKSTLVKLIEQLYPSIHAIQRSRKEQNQIFEKLRQQIKHIDKLTYTYAFEKDRQDFEPTHSVEFQNNIIVPVHWVMLDLEPTIIQKRISKREEMGIYESKKCVEYYSYVYLELATFYGMTVVNVQPSPEVIVGEIFDFVQTGANEEIRSLALKHMTTSVLKDENIEEEIIKFLTDEQTVKIVQQKVIKELQQNESMRQLYFPELQNYLYEDQKMNLELGRKLAARWIIINNCTQVGADGQLSIGYKIDEQKTTFRLLSPSFVFTIEGESKLIFQVRSKIKKVELYFKDKLWILLKSTIYSHTNQHCGQIQNLGKIRAIGSNLFLQMLRRNNLQHAYLGINSEGVICSKRIVTNGLEVVFKKQFVGTDKHSYFNLCDNKNLVQQEGKYNCGIYVRFDWRNPNHQMVKYPKEIINLNPYYYVIQKNVGKQKFFKTILQKAGIIPMGDKAISQDLIDNYIDAVSNKKSILKLYCAFTYYCSKVGLQIIDGCCMFNYDGSVAWSEINPDCMRVKKIENGKLREDYDKDIWRIGGSASKDKIIMKWTLFNKLFIDYFLKNRFHQTELLNTTPLSYPLNEEANNLLKNQNITLTSEYKSIFKELSSCTQKRKEIIGTIDISDSKPTLVKSSLLSQTHSQNSLQQAYNYVSLLPKLVLVDLDAAMGKDINNRLALKKLKRKSLGNIYGVGGGIRDLETLNFYLNELAFQKLILSSNLQLLDNLSKQIIQNRIIIELSINEKNQILTHGRTVNTQKNVIQKIIQLSKIGVTIVSLTFHHKEGHLQGIPREQFRDIMFQIPGAIKSVIIAGGISTLDDLEFIWGFPKTIPQLGSAIWKNKITIVQIYDKLINFDQNGLCPAIITDSTGTLLGQVFMNKQSLKDTIESRQLYRYSRKLKRLIKKGQQSGNIQKIVGIQLDCDNDCLNIIVEEGISPFCHFKSSSCFGFENSVKNLNLQGIQRHIWRKKQTGSGYSKKMQQNQHLAMSKCMEQAQQFSFTKSRHIQEAADFMSHMLMYFNAKGISFSQVVKQLDFRSKKVQLPIQPSIKEKKIHIIGVMGGKHFQKIDTAALNILGIQIVRENNRSLKINYVIKDQNKFQKYFKDQTVELLGIKSKDMGYVLDKKIVSSCFNYSIMMENYPQIWKQHQKQQVSDIRLVLLKRKGEQINPKLWTNSKKGRIASEYPMSLVRYFDNLGINQSCYSVVRVGGGTESYLMNSQFDYCDAIVETGKTVQDNNLQVVEILSQPIYGALYTLL